MSNSMLKIFIEKGYLLDKDMLAFLNELEDEDVANEIINKIAIISRQKIITKSLVDQNIDKIKPILYGLDSQKRDMVSRFFSNVQISFGVSKEDIDENNLVDIDLEEGDDKNAYLKIISSPTIAQQKLTVKDFVKHFKSRYNLIKNILVTNSHLENLTSIDKISGNNRNFSIIGIVTNKSVTKNKNLILDVEDLTGRTKLLINQNREEVYEKSKEILLDDVIGFNCSGTKDFLFVNDLFFPDGHLKEKHHSEEDIYAIFTSDIHIGSGNFLEHNFSRFVNWLSGVGCDDKQKETLKKIKYMFVVGDSIDGVGIYPGQEKDLKIKDIVDQYKRLSEFYEKIPSHINIIQCAGQHDAVRVAEPQPPIGTDFGESLHKFNNLHLVSNPSLVEIDGGIKVLMYHGASMHGVISEIEELRMSNAHSTPAKVVKHLLLRRHLAPSHGSTVYIPDAREDPMVIKEVPDIITTGDLHRTDIDKYNGVLIICNSCWQSITAFEEKVGNQPDPCKVPIVNLKTGSIKILDFSEDEDIDTCKVKGEDVN